MKNENKDQGAAVRGEAVAEIPGDETIWAAYLAILSRVEYFGKDDALANAREVFKAAVPVSPRAADALDSQPTAPTINYVRSEWESMCRKAVAVLNKHIVPDGISDHDALNELYGIFDSDEYRATGAIEQDACEARQQQQMSIDRAVAASQPAASANKASIGDDAGFLFLMTGITGIDTEGENYKRFARYIDNFRAPAAQAASVAPTLPEPFGYMGASDVALISDNTARYRGRNYNYKATVFMDTGAGATVAVYTHTQVLAMFAAPQQEGSEAGNG